MLAVTMLSVMASQAQTWDSLYDAAKGIERSWKSKSLKVGNAYPQAKVHNFAHAFCSAYPQYKPCANLLKYLKNIAAYNPYKDEYSINDAPRNGWDIRWKSALRCVTGSAPTAIRWWVC